MSHPFVHPSSKKIIAELKEIFKNKNIFFSVTGGDFVFVCGGNELDDFRPRFTSYLCSNDHKIIPLLAEDAIKDLLSHSNPEFINLAEFEDLIAEIFDSILIFPESSGSIAELGFFSNNTKIQQKIVVANNIQYQGDSFISLGPITRVNETSNFRPTIFLDKNNPNFSQVIERLLKFSTDKKIKRERFNYATFNKLTAREKMAVVFELIYIFRIVNIDGLEHLTKKIFVKADTKELRRIVSILTATGLITRVGDHKQHFIVTKGKKPLLEIDRFEINKVFARATLFIRENDKDIFEILKSIGHA